MAEVLRSPPSSSSSSIQSPIHNAALFQQTQSYLDEDTISRLIREGGKTRRREKREKEQLSLVALLVELVRKNFSARCRTSGRDSFCGAVAAGCSRTLGRGVMEIGFPSNVQHVNHVTFDRFDGFLGLPVEFEPEVPRRAPSASVSIFGVSTESMQLSYDHRGNSIPTILLLMQSHLYWQGGLKAEGIFRITAGNSQEEQVRDQLNRGIIPHGVDVHCLGGLIKAWFRELPRGILDNLSPEQVIHCQSEEDCDTLLRLLPPTEAALLDWAINLMADVVQQEHINKMNARNIAMVFAPNMTQMADPLIALMHAVQVMNFLKMLIERTLRERENSTTEPASVRHIGPSDDNGHHSSTELHTQNHAESHENTRHDFSCTNSEANQVDEYTDEDYVSSDSDTEEEFETPDSGEPKVIEECKPMKTCQSSDSKWSKFDWNLLLSPKIDSKVKVISNLCRLNSMTERFEAWR